MPIRPFDGGTLPLYETGMASRKRKPARAAQPRRPVLGNDPFERGAAERPVLARPRSGSPPPPPAAARPAAPPRRPGRGPRRPPLGDGEARLAEVARSTGAAAYTEELRELLVRLRPALRDAVAPLASLATLLGSTARLDEHGMDADLLVRGRAVLDFFLGSWWRVDVHGADLLPDEPFVLVANHGGTVHWDAAVLRATLARQATPRELRPLLDPRALRLR